MLSARRGAAVFPFIWKTKRLLNIGSERELKRAIQMVNSLANEVIRQRRKLGFSSTHDLLSRFMGSVQDDKYLRDIVISFMLAGRDTVASSLTLFFLQLSKHSHVKASIREELERIDSFSAVVKRFDIEVLNGDSPKFVPGLTACLSGGLLVRVLRRGEGRQ
ncbi:cytochrome P450 94C1-like protein [Carex littledalei]|uniref:Cytochrome P450 94C1-like protein n=1 Tax=Carex littledalei TaxID=544730 RepID=A0A833RGG1_9POAL|nr:cytochrome P450 94C1-like protein [Carex littledalei]